MRFYNIAITNPETGAAILPASLNTNALNSGGSGLIAALSARGLPTASSGQSSQQGITSLLPNGEHNPAALNVEFDIPTANFADPDGGAFLRIWGLGLGAIGAAFNLNGMNIAVTAGMSKGLPLANPAQQGLVLKGSILQAYGNWIGLDQTIDLNFNVGAGSVVDPKNFSFTWLKGTPLSTAIAQTLSTALPTFTQVINISSRLVLAHDEHGFYQSAQQFATFINGISKVALGAQPSAYRGVTISADGNKVYVWDGTQPSQGAVKEIAFQDMIGQPTWIGPETIQVKLVLRGDLANNLVIKLPQSLVTTTAASQLRFQDKTTFTGNFVITQIHHYGNFRQPDAMSWNTTVQAVPDRAGFTPQTSDSPPVETVTT